jgi:hypothetical protein
MFLLELAAMCAGLTMTFMFLSARAITLWSGPRAAPRWAAFFSQFSREERELPQRGHPGQYYAAFAAAFEVAAVYIAAHPASVTAAGSAIFVGQLLVASAWLAYFFRLPRQPRDAWPVPSDRRRKPRSEHEHPLGD